MHAKFQPISMQNAKVLNEDRQNIERGIKGDQMGKIMDKLNHNYNAFPELQTKFFRKQWIIWSIPPSFKEFHYSFYIFKISGTINNEEKITTSGISHLAFPNITRQVQS